MIAENEIIRLGRITKPHGVKGEVNATLDYDVDLMELPCIVICIDGINVPFFLKSQRPKSTESVILGIDDIDDEFQAKELAGHDYYALKNDVDISDDEIDAEGGFISGFIGFTLIDADGETVGEIVGYDDSTENLLFIVATAEGQNIYVPVADDLIMDISPENRTITMSVPEGLLDL